MPTAEESLQVAAALTRAFASRDSGLFKALYAEDAIIWHAATKRTQTKQENVAFLGAVFGLMRDARYEEVVRFPTAEGFVQHHVIRGIFNDGQPVPELYACMAVAVRDERIIHLREWFDPAQFGEVWKRLGISFG